MNMALARIVLRYLSGALLSAGWITRDIADQLAMDPDMLMLVGGGIAIATEAFYALAKRKGWTL